MAVTAATAALGGPVDQRHAAPRRSVRSVTATASPSPRRSDPAPDPAPRITFEAELLVLYGVDKFVGQRPPAYRRRLGVADDDDFPRWVL